MALLIVLAALAFLMLVAYRGYSVILFAPVAALGAVLLTDPGLVAPIFTGLFMDKMVGFLKLYFPVFMLGAVFGKLIELSGFSREIVAGTIGLLGEKRAILSIVLVCALLTYGGVSLFVVVFAVYPFAAELFRQADIPKRLIPGTIALGAFTFTMDSLPGTPQIQNIIPTAFFGTDTWAAPWLGSLGSLFILGAGLFYLERRRRAAARASEGYGDDPANEPAAFVDARLAHPLVALLPLLVVGIANKYLSPDFVQHSGAAERPRADWVAGFQRPRPAPPPGASAAPRQPGTKEAYLMADGDIVIRLSSRGNDKNNLTWHMFRVSNGQIVEEWQPGAGRPPAGAGGPPPGGAPGAPPPPRQGE